MKMRKELFNAIKEKLAIDVPAVKHVALWNHNVEFIEQEDGWERPAVFVESGRYYRAAACVAGDLSPSTS